MLSECCDAKVFKARSAGGWYIGGILVHEWYECSQCKQACDTIEETEPETQTEQGYFS